MNGDNHDWLELNRYVDGELPSAGSAKVAARAANEESTASSIAALHAMKSALAEVYGQDTVVIAAAPRRRMRDKWIETAACIAVVSCVIGGGALWLFSPGGGMKLASESSTTLKAESEDLAVWTTGITQGSRVDVPDISSAGLTAVFVEHALAANGVSMTHVGYLGHHGCRLGLYIAPPNADGRVSSFFPESQIQVLAWRDSAHRYFAVASGMNNDRFAVVAAALKAATTGSKSIVGELRVALAGAHQPCAS